MRKLPVYIAEDHEPIDLQKHAARPWHQRLAAPLMLPREHGAWAMLLMPYVLGTVAAGWGGWPSTLVIIATLSFFVASRPLELATQGGRRGAWVRLAAYSALGGLTGAALLILYGRWLLLPLGVVAGSVLAAQPVLRRHRLERSSLARLASIAALSATGPAAYYAASGALDQRAAAVWLLASLYSGASVFYVRLFYRPAGRGKGAAGSDGRAEAERSMLAYVAVALAASAGLGAIGFLPPLAILAFLPTSAKALVACRRRHSRPTLKQIGIAEIGHAAVFLLLASVATLNWG